MRGSHVKYQSSSLPSSFKGITSFDMMAYIRERLTKNTPETSLGVSKKYLRDASFALFMDRARDGIIKSGSKDLIPHYDVILKGGGCDGVMNQLSALMDDLRQSSPEKGKEEVTAQRHKVAFALLKAAQVRGA